MHVNPQFHIQQLIVEVLFLGTASVSGLYYRIMSDAAHNRTVDGTRTGIQQRVKLECEREQQEQLLLSVIPAYIAAEVRLQSPVFCVWGAFRSDSISSNVIEIFGRIETFSR